MIIVKLMGGLGNQMFQYAVGRNLACKLGVPLKLDSSYLRQKWWERFKGNALRNYALGVFNVRAELAKPCDLPPYAWFPTTSLVKITNSFIRIFRPDTAYILREVPFDLKTNLANLNNALSNVYLDGFWQSEEYFKEIKDIIVEDFKLKTQPLGLNLELVQKIASSNSISLHIRRGDYLLNTRTHSFHGLCSLEYYLTCIKKIKEKIKNPHFFVFGDDLEWAKKKLQSDDPLIFVEHNLNTPAYYEDLKLMSLCQHNIIANSSFSWWAAWLNQNPHKIVLAPKPWFKAKPDFKDIIPTSWTKVETRLE